ncbi:hypothetical protein ABPG72_007297 [Tetrahymena utriculariae]
MKNLIIIFFIGCVIFSTIQATNKGAYVGCAYDNQNCSECGTTPETQNMFTYADSCYIQDCDTIGSARNGWICYSCYAADTTVTEQYFDGTSCVADCPDGQYASPATGYTCQVANPGQVVTCAKGPQECQGCGQNGDYTNQFTYNDKDGSCIVTDCSSNAVTYLNGYVCNSCSQASGSGNIPKGQYYNHKTCVDSCPSGYKADQSTGFVCLAPPNPGVSVQCSNNSQDCNACGASSDIYDQFTYQSGQNCSIVDCHYYAAQSLNGWVCKSCALATGSDNIPQGEYYDQNAKTCVKTCPAGQQATADNYYTCQPMPIPVPCSNDSSTCKGCADNSDIQNYFNFVSGNNCIVQDCRDIQYFNGWVCNSCNLVNNDTPFQGQYYNGFGCITSCPPGSSASAATGFTCQIINPGASVACSQDSSTCGGCGQTNSIQNMFIYVKNSFCSVTDCSSNIIGSNLNGWVCNSCKSASGSGNIAAGQYFDGKNCVANCPSGKQASAATGFVCQYPPSPGAAIACSTDSPNCGGCGVTNAIQSLFTNGKGNVCSVTDCNLSVVRSNLNGWVCKSCSSASGAGNIAAGQYYDGTTCVTSCPNGYSASAATGYVCKINANPGNDVACSNDSSTCGGCGSTNIIQGFFTHGKGNNCSVTDCTATVIGSNLNGWVCKSCSSASGTGNIVAGQYYDGKTCVANCPSGQSATADTGYVCKATSNPSAGNNDSSHKSNKNLTNYILGFTTILNILF